MKTMSPKFKAELANAKALCEVLKRNIDATEPIIQQLEELGSPKAHQMREEQRARIARYEAYLEDVRILSYVGRDK